jgi:hypothetical protein
MNSNIKSIHDNILEKLIPDLRDLVINGIDDSKRIIFICGKDKTDTESYRYRVSSFLEKFSHYQLAFPEDLFEDLLEGQANHSLLALETQLANAVDLIILIPESPGSFAELGAFTMLPELAKKMLVLRQGRYKSDKSFINHGPIRLLKHHKGKVIDLPSNFNHLDVNHTLPLLKQVRRMAPQGRRKKALNNILLYQDYILLFSYIFDRLDSFYINKLMAKILEKKLTPQEQTACRAATHSLIRLLLLEKRDGFFTLTTRGFEEAQRRYFALSKVNDLRIKVMNIQL